MAKKTKKAAGLKTGPASAYAWAKVKKPKIKRPRLVEEDPFASWDADRDDLRPFMNLDDIGTKGPVYPIYPPAIREALAARGEKLNPWTIEDDCSVRTPWGEIFSLERLPPGVKEAARRCQSGGPWRTTHEDAVSLQRSLGDDYDDCTSQLTKLARYRYMAGALQAATGKFFGRPWDAELDFVGRCIRTRPERPARDDADRGELLELDGLALDRRRRTVIEAEQAIDRVDDELFEKADRAQYRGYPGGGRCVELVHAILDQASEEGAFEAERAGPDEPINTLSSLRETKTLSWCLRRSPAARKAFDDDAAERFAQLDIEDPSGDVRAARRRQHVAQYGEESPGAIVPPEMRPLPSRGFYEELEERRRRGQRRGRVEEGEPTPPEFDIDNPGASEGTRMDGAAKARRRSKIAKAAKRRKR